MNKVNILPIHQELSKTIAKLLKFSKLINLSKTDNFYLDIYFHSLEIFSWTSNNTLEFKDLNKYLKKFQSLFSSKKEINLNKKFDFEDTINLLDEINYITIFIENNFKVDIKNANIESLIEKSTPEDEKNNDFEKNKDLLIYKNLFKNNNFKNNFFNNESSYKDFMDKSKAIFKLKTEIDSGKIYIYKTKPKINVFVKYLMASIISLGLIVSIVNIFFILFQIITKGNNSGNNEKYSIIFVTSISSLIFFGINLQEIIKSFNNENFKYSFSKKNFYYHIVFLTICWLSIFPQIDTAVSSMDSTFLKVSVAIHGILIFINSFLFFFSYFYLNPPKNKTLISSLMDKSDSKEDKKK